MGPSKAAFKTIAIIPSAGAGLRMGSEKKNYLPLLGRPVLAHALKPFEDSNLVDEVVVVVAPGDEEFCVKNIIGPYGLKKVTKVIPGGVRRQDSVRAAVDLAGEGFDLMVVHDGARPLVTTALIERVLKKAHSSGAAIAAVRVKDTVKEVSGDMVRRTVPREDLWSVQTPQAFRSDILRKAFEEAGRKGLAATDESSLVESMGVAISVVEGSYENFKITTREDLPMAECVLKRRGP